MNQMIHHLIYIKMRPKNGKKMTQKTSDRDMATHPYSPDEERVATWLNDLTGVGGGDDPIGFIMCSLQYSVSQRNKFRDALKTIAITSIDNVAVEIAKTGLTE
jgi:hypothetical protein